jgi:hypothetical protein
MELLSWPHSSLFTQTNHCRRCECCGHTGHVGQYCKAGVLARGADAALWSVFFIPAALLTLPAEGEDTAFDAAMAEGPLHRPPLAFGQLLPLLPSSPLGDLV